MTSRAHYDEQSKIEEEEGGLHSDACPPLKHPIPSFLVDVSDHQAFATPMPGAYEKLAAGHDVKKVLAGIGFDDAEVFD